MTGASVLVLMSCSGVKAAGRRPLLDLYAGPMWLTLKTHMGIIPRRNVFVLSAKLGFEQASLCEADPYDARLGPEQAARLIARGAKALNDRMGTVQPGRGMGACAIATAAQYRKPYTAVICAASGLYREVLDAWRADFVACGVIAAGAAHHQVAGGIGVQRAQLRAFLDLYQKAAP